MFFWRTYEGGDIFIIHDDKGFNFVNSRLHIMHDKGSFSLNTWTHLGFTLDCLTQGCKANHYVNGNLKFALKLQQDMPKNDNNKDKCFIGGVQGYASLFNGYIDDLMAWNYTLTSSQMMRVKQFDYEGASIRALLTFKNGII